MRFVLIRHGQTLWNREKRIQGWKDSPITDDAREALRLLELPVLNDPVVYCSDLGRAQDSANIIASLRSLNVICDARLRERRLGMLEGEVIDENPSMSEHWKAYHNRYTNRMDTVFGAESETEFENRIRSFKACSEKAHPGQDVIIVSHGEWIRAFTNIVNGVPSWYAGRGIEANGKPVILESSLLQTAN